MKMLIGICAAAISLIAFQSAAFASSFTVLDEPRSSEGTLAFGIDGANIVGAYEDGSGMEKAFLHNGPGWTTLEFPGATSTRAYAIYGKNIVGEYHTGYLRGAKQYSFLYDGSNWTTIGTRNTQVVGIYGNYIVGNQDNSGFVYDGSSWTTLNAPGSNSTAVSGIYDNKIIGNYFSVAEHRYRGFIYSEGVWTTLEMAPESYITYYNGISGNNLIGVYYSSTLGDHGFLYDGKTWTTIDGPNGEYLRPYGISGDNVVGLYHDGYRYHGFELNTQTVPEPQSWVFFIAGFGIVGMALRRRNVVGTFAC